MQAIKMRHRLVVFSLDADAKTSLFLFFSQCKFFFGRTRNAWLAARIKCRIMVLISCLNWRRKRRSRFTSCWDYTPLGRPPSCWDNFGKIFFFLFLCERNNLKVWPNKWPLIWAQGFGWVYLPRLYVWNCQSH